MMGVKKLLKRTRARKKHTGSPGSQNKFVKNDAVHSVKKPKQKKTLVIAQEIKFARVLASNDKKARTKMLKNLRAWITVRSKSSFVFTETDFMRLWKGLFYCMWMSDKPLVQEELAESISNLVHCFETMESAVLYTKCALRTLSTEWFGIDQYRLDKFQMLARRILRQTFVMCKNREWNEEGTKEVARVVEEILLDSKGSLGFKFHITEIFMEELAKVCGGEIPEDLVTDLLRPFAVYLAAMEDERQIRNVVQHIFRYLIFQSDVGIDYMEKFDAWRKAGYPTGSIEAMKKMELSDEELEDLEEPEGDSEEESSAPESSALDPRAGRVNVDLPQIPFDPLQISNLIKQYKFHPSSTTKTRRRITRLIKEFTELSKGTMPLGIQKVDIPKKKSPDTNPKKAALKFLEFEEQLYADSAKNRGKKKRKNDHIEPKPKKLKVKDSKSSNSEASPEESPQKSPEVVSKKLKKPQDTKEKLSPKKKSLQKEFKVKTTKTKANKLKKVKNALNGELMDGIDDFVNFKKSKKIKYDLNSSWDVSTSEVSAPSTPIVTPKVLKPQKTTPESKKSSLSQGKPSIIENIRVGEVPWLHPMAKKLEDEVNTPTKTPGTPQVSSSTKKRVKIMLQKNTAQHTSEYFKQLIMSPGIPYDANKKPGAGVLKPSPLPSPVNPFYKNL
ncbi:ribosomal RNA processing protein 1 homolog [Diachasma alloeum]|uniref:ribosomal RNA processing protein 1 homolog n=1 Tax=Diachasma alloeum TaxID=454923 RepID=UPI0007381207|nr:ribosomal RNA processing protein 1 homolog [Diachasma alloeum]